jgi:hypothetical protein
MLFDFAIYQKFKGGTLIKCLISIQSNWNFAQLKKTKKQKTSSHNLKSLMGILSRCRWFGTELSFVGFYSGGFVWHFKEMHLIETHKW